MASSTKRPSQSAHAAPQSAVGGGPAGPRQDAGRLATRFSGVLAIAAGAILLRVLSGVGFANYDTLYALVWGQQLARGETPQYGIPVAPTPHPLVEGLGVVVAPLGPHATEQIAVALGFLALSACGWAVYRLGSLWFNRPAGAVAAVVLLTRVPILSDGVRAYVDVPYLVLVLCALIVETRRRRAGAPVLALLALAGLLRPEAWVFSGVYWIYLAVPLARARVGARRASPRNELDGVEPGPRTLRQLAWLALLAAAAPLVWVASDWLVTGDATWSLTNTRHTAQELHRERGIAKVPEYVPRRIGEILAPAGLAAAAVGGVLSLWWLRARALAETGTDWGDTRSARIPKSASAEGACHPVSVGALAGVVAVGAFVAFAAAGLPIDTRYAFLAAAILCVFCGGALCGWAEVPRGERHRRWWMAAAAAAGAALLVTAPAQYRVDHHQLDVLARQQRIQDDLVALVRADAITVHCGPIGVPNHAPIPLLALWLRTPPAEIVSAQVQAIAHGAYVDPASAEVQRDYVLDPHDPNRPVTVPPGFSATRANRSWRIFQRCG